MHSFSQDCQRNNWLYFAFAQSVSGWSSTVRTPSWGLLRALLTLRYSKDLVHCSWPMPFSNARCLISISRSSISDRGMYSMVSSLDPCTTAFSTIFDSGDGAVGRGLRFWVCEAKGNLHVSWRQRMTNQTSQQYNTFFVPLHIHHSPILDPRLIEIWNQRPSPGAFTQERIMFWANCSSKISFLSWSLYMAIIVAYLWDLQFTNPSLYCHFINDHAADIILNIPNVLTFHGAKSRFW